MLSQFEDFPSDLEDLSFLASNIKVSWKDDKATLCSVNSRVFQLAARTLALWSLILRLTMTVRGFSTWPQEPYPGGL
jgi:hypothetical protein